MYFWTEMSSIAAGWIPAFAGMTSTFSNLWEFQHMNSGQERGGMPGMAGGNPAPALDVAEGILYLITQLTQMLVVITIKALLIKS